MKTLWPVTAFDAISLETLNTKAAMLERRDNKYVVHQAVLQEALPTLVTLFDVLEIKGNRHFGYKTVYFDSNDFASYYSHHQGRRQRCKIRVRSYLGTDLCFLEIKLKDKRGITIKKRMKYNPEQLTFLDATAMAFINQVYSELYRREFTLPLRPVLEMNYKRVTLVAKEGGERMTVDTQLVFNKSDEFSFYHVDSALSLVETKSDNGNGIADKILRQLHQHPTSSCSKYCVGMAALKKVKKYNKFMPALRKLNILSDLQPSAGYTFVSAA
jgi:VTC domain